MYQGHAGMQFIVCRSLRAACTSQFEEAHLHRQRGGGGLLYVHIYARMGEGGGAIMSSFHAYLVRVTLLTFPI